MVVTQGVYVIDGSIYIYIYLYLYLSILKSTSCCFGQVLKIATEATTPIKKCL